MRSDDEKENVTLKDMANKNRYYSQFLDKLEEVMALYKDKTGETPKLFNRINEILKRHSGHDYKTNHAAMKELYQIHSRQHEFHTMNPIKGAKKVLNNMGANINIHGHDISNELYKAFAQIDLTIKSTSGNSGLNILQAAENNLSGKPVYRK